MGKDKKKGPKANVFKVAGAKSLKRKKAKVVNLGLKNIHQRIADIDKQFLDLKNETKPDVKKPEVKPPQKKNEKKVPQEEVTATIDNILKMDL